MSQAVASVLLGALATASFVVALFFLKFWQQTRDSFFLLFSVAFAVDAVGRLMLGFTQPSNEMEPLFYVTRVVTFGLIIIAIVQKNRPPSPRK